MRRHGRFLKSAAIAALLTAVVPALFAADDSKIIYPSGNPQVAAPVTSSAASGASTATLVVAILLAGVGAWFYWRNRKAVPGMRGAQNLVVEETKSLGNRQYLVVASYGHEKFLLGVCPGRIDLLSPLGRPGEESDR